MGPFLDDLYDQKWKSSIGNPSIYVDIYGWFSDSKLHWVWGFPWKSKVLQALLGASGSASICSRMRKPQPESWTEATMSMTKRRANLKTSWWQELCTGWWISYDFCFPCWSSTSWCVLDHFGGGETLIDHNRSILEMSRWPRLRSRHVQKMAWRVRLFGEMKLSWGSRDWFFSIQNFFNPDWNVENIVFFQ